MNVHEYMIVRHSISKFTQIFPKSYLLVLKRSCFWE